MPSKKTPTTKWLYNKLGLLPSFTLCFDENDYFRALDYLKIPKGKRRPYCESPDPVAWVKFFDGPDNCAVCLVCLSEKVLEKSPAYIMGSLVHEAVHVAQRAWEVMGEDRPSSEFQAYCIETISTELIREFINHKWPKLNGVIGARKPRKRA